MKTFEINYKQKEYELLGELLEIPLCYQGSKTFYYIEDDLDTVNFIKSHTYRRDLPIKEWFYLEDIGSDDYPNVVCQKLSQTIKTLYKMSKDSMRLAMVLEGKGEYKYE